MTRLERMVRREVPLAGTTSPFAVHHIVRLMQAELHVVQRIIHRQKRQKQLRLTADFPATRAYRMACDDILAKLEGRLK